MEDDMEVIRIQIYWKYIRHIIKAGPSVIKEHKSKVFLW